MIAQCGSYRLIVAYSAVVHAQLPHLRLEPVRTDAPHMVDANTSAMGHRDTLVLRALHTLIAAIGCPAALLRLILR